MKHFHMKKGIEYRPASAFNRERQVVVKHIPKKIGPIDDLDATESEED